MFIHIFKTRIKSLLRGKANLFWIMCFPLILATLISIAVPSAADFDARGFIAIEVAVVPHDNIALEQMLNELAQGDEPLLNITYASAEEATTLLADGIVDGVITAAGENVRLTVKSGGITQTVLTNLLDNFTQTNAAIHAIIEDNPTMMQGDFLRETRDSYIDEVLISVQDSNPNMYNYHTILAMACLFGGYLAIKCIAETQPNQSTKGVRRSIAPIHKLHIFAYEFLAITLVHITLMLLLLTYMILILGADFGTKIPALMFAVATSSLLGVSVGVFFAALVPKGERISSSIFSIVAIFSCFLAGIRGFGMKATLETTMPFLRYINPATLMSDSYYNLYVYDTYNGFGSIILTMLSMSFICIIGTCFIVRRQTYASL